jgi:hypothetical protein
MKSADQTPNQIFNMSILGFYNFMDVPPTLPNYESTILFNQTLGNIFYEAIRQTKQSLCNLFEYIIIRVDKNKGNVYEGS